ncbi:double-strand break repair protein AddB [Acetobacteraceae bacterium]|nr:double-strand break repair protein AddB [Acetobacteraceae bacterium]
MSLHALPLRVSFFETIAKAWLEAGKEKQSLEKFAFDEGMILVPGRRAARHLSEAFLRVLDGKALLLPRIAVIGDMERSANFEAIEKLLKLPPAISKLHRTALLMSLVKKFQEVSEETELLSSAKILWGLASSLGELIDEADRAEISLSEAIEKAQAESQDLSAHWEKILKFLAIVSQALPEILTRDSFLNPVAREVERLNILAQSFEEKPPLGNVWAVGFVDGSSGVANILSKVAALPKGRVILRGIDLEIPDSVWEILPQSHPQFIFKDLLERMGKARADFQNWDFALSKIDGTDLSFSKAPTSQREIFWREAFSPKMAMQIENGQPMPLNVPDNTWRIEAEDTQQEARAIALALRDGISKPAKTAALVTPDRSLAIRVSAELKRFGINADDSAGAALAGTPSAVFLRLVIAAASENFSAVSLLALLKHPRASFGLGRDNARPLIRCLEREILRGAPINGGITGLRQKLESLESEGLTVGKQHELMALLDRLESAFEVFVPMMGQKYQEFEALDLLRAAIASAEKLALPEVTQEIPEPESRLWRGEDGQKLAEHLSELLVAFKENPLPPQPLEGFADFLSETMQGISITGLRNYLDGEEVSHPRVFILGILEARLLSFDRVILGGLNEGIWPPLANCGPWMGRMMRKSGGLFLPERRLGAFAQDFQAFACGTGEVIFSRSMRDAERPNIAAPWLIRAKALMGKGKDFPSFKSLTWAKNLDIALHVKGAEQPFPKPPIAFRPRKLGVTSVAILQNFPYAIYANKILELSPLAGLAENMDYKDFGILIHKALETIFERKLPQKGNLAQIETVFFEALADAPYRQSIKNWWHPRLKAIAAIIWEREKTSVPKKIFLEQSLSYQFQDPSFELTGRADRVDILKTEHGERAVIYDYKTGTLPRLSAVEKGEYPQLLLEGAVLRSGGFDQMESFEIEDLIYWQLKGSSKQKENFRTLLSGAMRKPGPEQQANIRKQMNHILDNLYQLIVAYENPEKAYEAGNGTLDSPYAQLARMVEWRGM